MKRFAWMVVGACSWAASADARSVAWFDAGAEVALADTVDVPLLRHRGDPRPQVRVEVAGQGGERVVLAVLDAAYGWTRIPWRIAGALGLQPQRVEFHGEERHVVEIPVLRIGDLTVRGLRAEVDGDELVLGLATLDGVGYALLPSEGVVRFVPGVDAAALLGAIGTPTAARRQDRRPWKQRGEKGRGNGVALVVEGAIAGTEGGVYLRTDHRDSFVTSTYDRGRRAGDGRLRGRGQVGALELPESWMIRDPSLSGGRVPLVGSLGYDQLYAVDLAVDPDRDQVAFRSVDEPRWEEAEPVRLAIARAAWEGAGLDARAPENDRPPPIGIARVQERDPKGDPGDTATARLEAELAQALWDAGELEAAIAAQYRASKAAGDRCGPRMDLGLMRMQWAGARVRQAFIMELVQQPLREAGQLWDRWVALDPAIRGAVREGRPVEGEVFQIEQEPRCVTAWGTLMASYVAQGDLEASSAIYRTHYGKDPLVAYAQGLSLLAQGRPETAEIPIREALSFHVAERGLIALGMGWAHAAQGRREPVFSLVEDLPALAEEHGLVAALIALEWGRMLDGEAGRRSVAKRLVRSDPYGIPAQLVALWLGVEEADPARLEAELARRWARDAAVTPIAVYREVFRALRGEPAEAAVALERLRAGRPPIPDLFAASALVASLNDDPGKTRHDLDELRLRYPVLPFETLALLPETE